jgi:hypothetical protein
VSADPLTAQEIEFVCDLLETVLSDEANTMGVFDVTSGGAMSPDEVTEYRAQLGSAVLKLQAMRMHDPAALVWGARLLQTIRKEQEQ